MPSPIAFALSPSHLSIRRHSSINRRNHVLTARRRPERHNRAGVFYASALSRYLTRLQSGENLHEEAGAAITVLVDGLKDGSINEIEGGGLLSLMPPDKQSSKSISSVAAMLRSRMISPTIHLDIRKGKPHQKAAKPQLLDIVGTGGDGFNTVNISTAAAILAAACGCTVAKSGNRSASSKSGSADVLEALGINLGNGEDELLQKCLTDAQICFLFARNHHPAIGAVGRTNYLQHLGTFSAPNTGR